MCWFVFYFFLHKLSRYILIFPEIFYCYVLIIKPHKHTRIVAGIISIFSHYYNCKLWLRSPVHWDHIKLQRGDQLSYFFRARLTLFQYLSKYLCSACVNVKRLIKIRGFKNRLKILFNHHYLLLFLIIISNRL